jgi:hypothetical protein
LGQKESHLLDNNTKIQQQIKIVANADYVTPLLNAHYFFPQLRPNRQNQVFARTQKQNNIQTAEESGYVTLSQARNSLFDTGT